MRQILCDHCGQPITSSGLKDDEMVKVGVLLGWGDPWEDAYRSEYHRRCVRNLTVAEVYKRTGLLPL